MKVINNTKQTIIADEAFEVNNFKDKTIGLLKYHQPRALIMRTRFGIHTFGMRYAIDVLVLNKESEVVMVKEELKPGNILLWNPKHDTVLELPTGSIDKSTTKLNDKLSF